MAWQAGADRAALAPPVLHIGGKAASGAWRPSNGEDLRGQVRTCVLGAAVQTAHGARQPAYNAWRHIRTSSNKLDMTNRRAVMRARKQRHAYVNAVVTDKPVAIMQSILSQLKVRHGCDCYAEKHTTNPYILTA